MRNVPITFYKLLDEFARIAFKGSGKPKKEHLCSKTENFFAKLCEL